MRRAPGLRPLAKCLQVVVVEDAGAPDDSPESQLLGVHAHRDGRHAQQVSGFGRAVLCSRSVLCGAHRLRLHRLLVVLLASTVNAEGDYKATVAPCAQRKPRAPASLRLLAADDTAGARDLVRQLRRAHHEADTVYRGSRLEVLIDHGHGVYPGPGMQLYRVGGVIAR